MNVNLLRVIFVFPLVLGVGGEPYLSDQAPEDPQRQGPEWLVRPTPTVTIGAVDGPDEYVLTNVLDATVLSDGTVVVGMFMRNFFEIRYYDETGSFISSAGRYGEGPFETRSGFISLERLRDSVLVVDLEGRYSVFGPRGGKVRSERLGLQRRYYPSNLLDQRHLGVFAPVPGGRDAEESSGSFYIHDLVAESTDSICSLSISRTTLASDGLILHPPFEPQAHWAAGGGRFWVGNSAHGEILGYSPNSEPPARIWLDLPRHEVSGEDQRLWKEFDLRGASGAVRRGYEAHHRSVAFPETYPLFQGIRVDVAGRVWVLQYEPPWSTEDYLWEVFSGSGERLGVVTVPFGLLPSSERNRAPSAFSPLLEVGTDYVLLIHKDELGVEYVRQHPLVRR